MDRGADEDDFLDLCEKYVQLAEDRQRVMALVSDQDLDEERAEEIDDIDVRQRILMWRILRCGEQAEPAPAAAPPASVAIVAQNRESGGAARGRFASERLFSARRWANFAQR